MKRQRSLLLSTSALTFVTALGVCVPTLAEAQCLTVSTDTTISDSATSCITWNSNNITLTGSGTVTATGAAVTNNGSIVGNLTNSGVLYGGNPGVYNAGGTIGTVTNNGSIGSGGDVFYNFGLIATIINNGTINSTGTKGISNNNSSSTIGAILNNSGGIISGATGITNYAGVINTITNVGLISGNSYGVYNSSTISTIGNTGTITARYNGIENITGGIIASIANNMGGVIYGQSTAITNYGSIGAISNSGTISGVFDAIYNSGTIGNGATAINSTGTIVGALNNSGTIIGNINVNQNLILSGGTGTLTGGTITTNNHDLTFDSSTNQILGDALNVGVSNTVTVAGTLLVDTAISITGNYTQSPSATLLIGVTNPSSYGDLIVSGNSTLTGDAVSITALSGSLSLGEVFTIAQTAGTFNYAGLTAVAGHGLGGAVSSIAANGFENLVVTLTSCTQNISSNTTISGSACLLNWTGGNISIASSGHIIGNTTAVLDSGSSVGTLANSGSISGSSIGVYNNSGSISALINNDVISGKNAIFNTGTIDTINNNSGATISVGDSFGSNGIYTNGVIGVISNSGLISGATGIGNDVSGTITSIGNLGSIHGVSNGILNLGSIGTITNSGVISNNLTGGAIYNNAGVVGTISNNGTISSNDVGIYNNNNGTIGAIANNGIINANANIGIFNNSGTIGLITNGGTISGSAGGIVNDGLIGGGATAITSSGTIIGVLVNYGTIIGSINVNQSLTLSGGTGTLTGGTITTNNHDLTFDSSASQILGDALNVGASNTVTVVGTLQVNTPVSIAGNYAQNPSGELIIGVTNSSSYGELLISGNTTLTGDTVSITALSGSLTSGEVFTIAEASSTGSDFAGAIVRASGFQIAASPTISGNVESLIVTLSTCTYPTISSNTVLSGSACGITWNGGNLSISSSSLVISSSAAIANASSNVGSLTNSGVIVGSGAGISNSGSVAAITNNTGGFIKSSSAIFNSTSGTIGAITNDGTIIGSNYGIRNQSIIGSIINDGYIHGGTYGIYNDAAGPTSSISYLDNSGTVSGGVFALQNYGNYDTITNSGTLLGGDTGIVNHLGIGILTNTGTITGTSNSGIKNSALLSSLINSSNATISGGTYGILNTTSPYNSGSGTIVTLTNNGLISGGVTGILNTNNSTIGTLTNSGLIEGANAIYSGNGDTILSAITNTGTIAGNINVNQALTLTGGSAGALGSLTGYNSAVGTISTNNNNLTFDSGAYQLMDDDINVGASNTVFNNGLIRVNTTHTVTGNYSQAPSATLVVGVTDSSHYGELVISGTATLTGSSVLITPTSGSLSNGETLTIVQASNSGTSYSGVSATAAGFTATTSTLVSGGYDDLIVALSNGNGGSHTYATLGQNAGGVGGSVGAALDQIAALVAGGNQSSFAPILTALNNIGSQQSPAAEAAAIKQLAPSQLAPQLTATNLMANQTMDVIGQHQTTLLEQHGRGGTGKAAGSEIQAGVLWMQVDGGFASQASSASVAGYHQNFYGMTFGVDDHITKKATAGVAVSWVHSASRGSDSLNGDAVAVSTPEVSAYGSYRFGPAFVDGMLGVGYNMYSQSRGIGFLGSTASSSYGGMQYMGNLESGYDFTVTPRTTVTPLVGLQAVRTATDSYSETGAGAADLTVGHQIIDSYASSLGGRVTTVIPTVLGSLTPEVKLAWAHNLNNGAINTSATMAGVGFATSTPRSSPDGAELSLAATLQRTDNLSLRAEYDGDLRDGYQSHTGMLKGEYEF